MIALVKPTSLGAVPTDGSARIVSAKLEMYCIDGNGGSEITVTLVTSAWTEAGVNWSNQPTVGTTVGTFAPRCGDALESVDITAAVTAWAGGAPVYGLRLKASDTNGSDWQSTRRRGCQATAHRHHVQLRRHPATPTKSSDRPTDRRLCPVAVQADDSRARV